jgi:hypothetical protein
MKAGPSKGPADTTCHTLAAAEPTPRARRGVLCRSAADFGGRAVGAHIVARARARDLLVCECCPCLIEPGDRIYLVEDRRRRRRVICAECAGAQR